MFDLMRVYEWVKAVAGGKDLLDCLGIICITGIVLSRHERDSKNSESTKEIAQSNTQKEISGAVGTGAAD